MDKLQRYEKSLRKIAEHFKFHGFYPMDLDNMPDSIGNYTDCFWDGVKYGQHNMAEIARNALED